MYAVIFEVLPKAAGKAAYLEIAAQLRQHLEGRAGFISIERFQSLVDENKLLSLSFCESETAIESWRTQPDHRLAQQAGRDKLFASYRIRVAKAVRNDSDSERTEAPADARIAFDESGADFT